MTGFEDEEDEKLEKDKDEDELETEEVDEEMKEVSHEWEELNKNQPLGTRKSEEVTNVEYASRYKSRCPSPHRRVRSAA